MLVEIVWLVLGVTWLTYHYQDCPVEGAKEAVLGKGQYNLLRGETCGIVCLAGIYQGSRNEDAHLLGFHTI